MKIKACVSGMNLINLKSDIDSVIDMMFHVSLSNESTLNDFNLSVSFDKHGNIVSFPTLAKSSADKSYDVYIKRGRAVSEILRFEGRRAKSLYDKAFVIFNEFNEALENLNPLNEYDLNVKKNQLLEDAYLKINQLEVILN